MDTFMSLSFGTVLMNMFQGIFTAPSWHTFTYLAYGWVLATDRHTITTYLWLTGASAVKHFSRFYVFLGAPSTSNAGTSGGQSSAWRPSLSPRARSFGSASTIPPRKKPVAISKASPAIAMALAPRAKNTVRCGA